MTRVCENGTANSVMTNQSLGNSGNSGHVPTQLETLETLRMRTARPGRRRKHGSIMVFHARTVVLGKVVLSRLVKKQESISQEE